MHLVAAAEAAKKAIEEVIQPELLKSKAERKGLGKVLNARPGLVTMKDLPLPSAVTEDVRVYLTWKKSP